MANNNSNNVKLARVVFLVTFMLIGCNYQCTCFGFPRFQSVPTTVKTFENNTVTLPCVYSGAVIERDKGSFYWSFIIGIGSGKYVDNIIELPRNRT